MQISRSSEPHNIIDYYQLPNGKADVFLRKNETTETDEDGNTIYVVEEVYFQIDSSIERSTIENNFEQYWNFAESGTFENKELTIEERLAAAEDTINFLLGL